MRTFLVTGGAGFIGSHMVDRLIHDGHRVIVLDNLSTGSLANLPPAAIFQEGDVTDVATLRPVFENGIDAVLHIAGQASTIRAFSRPHEDLAVNVAGTVNVIQMCLEYRVPRLLYASSMTVYGDTATVPLPETEPCRPFSYYGITKYAAERYVLSTGQRSDIDFRFDVTAFRMFNVYGERQRLDNPYQGVMGFFLGSVLRHTPIIIHGDGAQSRDFVHIADVVDAWMAAVDRPASFNRVFNLGCGTSIAIRQLAHEVIAACGYPPSTYPLVWEPLRPGDQRHMVADIGVARQLLEWRPAIALAPGIKRTLAWARQSMGTPL